MDPNQMIQASPQGSERVCEPIGEESNAEPDQRILRLIDLGGQAQPKSV